MKIVNGTEVEFNDSEVIEETSQKATEEESETQEKNEMDIMNTMEMTKEKQDYLENAEKNIGGNTVSKIKTIACVILAILCVLLCIDGLKDVASAAGNDRVDVKTVYLDGKELYSETSDYGHYINKDLVNVAVVLDKLGYTATDETVSDIDHVVYYSDNRVVGLRFDNENLMYLEYCKEAYSGTHPYKFVPLCAITMDENSESMVVPYGYLNAITGHNISVKITSQNKDGSNKVSIDEYGLDLRNEVTTVICSMNGTDEVLFDESNIKDLIYITGHRKYLNFEKIAEKAGIRYGRNTYSTYSILHSVFMWNRPAGMRGSFKNYEPSCYGEVTYIVNTGAGKYVQSTSGTRYDVVFAMGRPYVTPECLEEITGGQIKAYTAMSLTGYNL